MGHKTELDTISPTSPTQEKIQAKALILRDRTRKVGTTR